MSQSRHKRKKSDNFGCWWKIITYSTKMNTPVYNVLLRAAWCLAAEDHTSGQAGAMQENYVRVDAHLVHGNHLFFFIYLEVYSGVKKKKQFIYTLVRKSTFGFSSYLGLSQIKLLWSFVFVRTDASVFPGQVVGIWIFWQPTRKFFKALWHLTLSEAVYKRFLHTFVKI